MARHGVVSAGVAQGHVPLVSGHVLLDRMLKRFPLLLDALLHLVSQLLIDSEVLHLQLHVALLLSVDQVRKHGLPARLEVFDALRHALVRDALMQLPLRPGLIVERVPDLHIVDDLRLDIRLAR